MTTDVSPKSYRLPFALALSMPNAASADLWSAPENLTRDELPTAADVLRRQGRDDEAARVDAFRLHAEPWRRTAR